MGIIYKVPVTEEQTREQVKTIQNDTALDAIRESIRNEASSRSSGDSALNQDLAATRQVLNQEINDRTNANAEIRTDLNTETTARINADTILDTKIDDEATARTNADATLHNEIISAVDDEKAKRMAAMNALNDALTTALDNEKSARESADESIRGRITAEATTRIAEDTTLATRIDAEATARAAEDAKITSALEDEKADRNAAVTALKTEILDIIGSETILRGTDFDAITKSITDEANARAAADSKIRDDLTDESDARAKALAALKTELTGKITTETTAREAADTDLASTFNLKLAGFAPLESPTFTGVPKVPSLTTGSNDLQIANKAYVDAKLNSIETNLNVFTAPTASAAGTQGQVPAPEKGLVLRILTNFGWRTPGENTITVSTLPMQSGSLTYNGNAQSPSWANYDPSKMEITGETTGTSAGIYTARVALIDMYMWSDTLDQRAKDITWAIGALRLTKPTLTGTDFTYDKTGHAPTINNFDAAYMSQTGTASATAAGDYVVSFSLKSPANTKWSDDSTGDINLSWRVGVAKFAKPAAVDDDFDYTGSSHTLALSGFDSEYMTLSGDTEASAVGTYKAVVGLKDKNNCSWNDGSSGDITISWSITKKVLTAEQSTGFAQSGTLTYNGSEQTVTITNFNKNIHALGSDTRKTAAGTYRATVSPAGSYVWSDGTTTPRVVEWKIGACPVAKPAANTSKFTYSAGTITFVPTYAPDESAILKITGTKSASALGSYSVEYSLKDASNYVWSGGGTGTVKIAWSIVANKLSADLSGGFEQAANLTYNGTSQTVTLTHTSATYHTITGTSGTDAGDYTASITPVYGYEWAEGGSDTKTVGWKIDAVRVPVPHFEEYPATSDFEYSGATINIVDSLYDYDSKYVQLSGNLAESEPGNYKITATLKNAAGKANYIWNNSTINATAPVDLDWSIRGKPVNEPTFGSSEVEFTYSGAEKSVSVSGFQSTYMESTGTLTATDAGDYSITYTLKDTVATRWANTEGDTVTLTWKIKRKPLTAAQSDFKATGELYYNGAEQSPTITGFDASVHDIIGNTQTFPPVDPTLWCAVITPKSNYCWNDGTTTEKVVPWTINPPLVRIDTGTLAFENGALVCRLNFTYDGNEKTILGKVIKYTVLKGTATDINATSGTATATNAGTYTVNITNCGIYRGKQTHISGGLYNVEFIPIPVDFTKAGTTETARTLTVVWTIDRARLSNAQSSFSNKTYEYSGTAKSDAAPNYDTACHTGANDINSLVNAGTYTRTIYPSGNYCWSNGGTEGRSVTITINKKKLTKPSASQTEFIYSGNAFNFLDAYVRNFDENTMSATGSTSATVPGDYSITVKLRDTNNYIWSDDTSDGFQINWKVKPSPIPAANSGNFAQAYALTYNTSEQTVTISHMDTARSYISSGTSVATYAGDYTCYVSPNKYHTWSDGTTDAKAVTWSIAPKSVPKPYCKFADTTIEWTGSEINWLECAIENYTTEGTKLSTTYKATNIGNYTFKISLRSSNYIWSDGTSDLVTFEWSIVRKRLSGSDDNGGWGGFYVYPEDERDYAGDGKMYYVNGGVPFCINGYNPDVHVLKNNGGFTTTKLIASSVMEYTWTIEPKSTYAWSDGTWDKKEVKFEVVKAPLYVADCENNQIGVEITDSDTKGSRTFPYGIGKDVNFTLVNHRGNTVTRSFPIRTSVEDPNIADINRASSTKFSIDGKENGYSFAVYTVPENEYYQAVEIVLDISVHRSFSSLKSWSQISTIAKSGRLLHYGEIGDTYPITLSGTVGTVDVSGEYMAELLDYDEDLAPYYSYWTFVNSNNWAIAFTDSYYGTAVTDGTKAFAHRIGARGTAADWKSSALRTRCTEFKNAMSNKSLIRSYPVDTGLGDGTTVSDLVWIPHNKDVWGKYGGFANAGRVWATGATSIHDFKTGASVKAWTRETDFDEDGEFGWLFNDTWADAHISYGLCPIFCI